MIYWFGETWNAPVNEEPHVATPAGENCIECTRKFKETDRGVLTACSPRIWGGFDLDVDGRRLRLCGYHLSCWLGLVVGNEMSHEVMARMPGRRDEIYSMLGHEGVEDPPEVGGWRTKGGATSSTEHERE